MEEETEYDQQHNVSRKRWGNHEQQRDGGADNNNKDGDLGSAKSSSNICYVESVADNEDYFIK